jgi:hypothetical protein
MKKSYLLILALVLALSLAACGGKDGGDDLLNRPASTSGQSDTDSTDNNPSGNTPDIAGAIDDIEKLSELDPATKQLYIDEARKSGGDIEFKDDGSVVITGADGSISIQNPDGTWTYRDTDGGFAQIGGEWPDNDFTKLVPKPDIVIAATVTENNEFTATFSGATLEQIEAYIEKVKAVGFEGEYSEAAGMSGFDGANAQGYNINIIYSEMASVMTISKP